MTATASSYQTDPQVQQHRWLILTAIGLLTFMSTLDGSIVNIALPVINRSLHIPMNQAEWIVSLYLIIICSLILFFGKLSDAWGKIKIFRLGSLLFILGSLLAGWQVNLTFLLGARTIQAIGASMTMATNNGIITEIFPTTERGRALGLIGSFVALGSIAGPGIGGLLLAHFSWSYIFWINVPLGCLAVLIAYFVLPQDITFTKVPIDKIGALSFAILIMTLFGGIFLGQQIGFQDPSVELLFLWAVISAIIFLQTERHQRYPLLEFKLFKNPNFSLSLLCALLIFITNFFFNVVTPFYLENARQLAPNQAGYILMIFPIIQVFAAPLAGTASDKIGPKLITFIGLLFILLSQIGYFLCGLHTSLWIFIGSVACMGLGNGIFSSPNNSLVMSSVAQKDLGIAGSINSLSRNLGMVIGIASATTILFAAMSHNYGQHVTTYLPQHPGVFIYGMHVVFFIALGLCTLATLLTGWRLWQKN